MRLPPRAFWTLTEASARWSCMPFDIVGWAALGKINLTLGIPPARCGSEMVAGFVTLPAQDIVRMFRRDGSGPEVMTIRRLRVPAQTEGWLYVTEPEAGIEVHREDIIIIADEASRFEAEYVATKSATAPTTNSGRYDWDAFMISVVKRVYEHGLPPSQNEWIRESLDWFSQRDPHGAAPDERTIRRRLQPIWQALRDSDEPEAA